MSTLPEGSRINRVFGEDLSRRGSNFTTRKSNTSPMSVLDLIGAGALSYKMAAYLSLVLGEGMNLFVCGEAASGKTTMLNAITTFIHPNAKIVCVEDTPDLQVPHPNWTREVARGASTSRGSEVTISDLLDVALRQRPDVILTGEIRGPEAKTLFQAMRAAESAFLMVVEHGGSSP